MTINGAPPIDEQTLMRIAEVEAVLAGTIFEHVTPFSTKRYLVEQGYALHQIVDIVTTNRPVPGMLAELARCNAIANGAFAVTH